MSIFKKLTDAVGLTNNAAAERAQKQAAAEAAQAQKQQEIANAQAAAEKLALANAEQMKSANAESAADAMGSVVAGGGSSEAANIDLLKRKRVAPGLSSTLGINV